jgi:hypothetical protein
VELWAPSGAAVGVADRTTAATIAGMTTTHPPEQSSEAGARTRPEHLSAARRVLTYPGQAGLAVFTAFALSAGYTVHLTAAGTANPSFDAKAPAAWGFYAVGFGLAALARSTGRRAAWTLAAALTALTAVALFVYPSTFTKAQQTTFGWFENDVYTGLLMLALYLTIQSLRRTALVPPAGGRTADRSDDDHARR